MPTINLGRVSIVPKGTWSSSASYKYLDLVYSGNKSYVALQASTNIVPTNTTYWMLLVDGDYSNLLSAHEAGTGVHTIAGVTGLQSALDSKEASGTASSLVTPLADRVTALEGKSQFSRYRFSPSGVSGSAAVSGLGHIYVTDIDGVGTTMTIDTNASTGGVVIPQTGRYRLSLELMTATGSGGGSFDFTKSGTLIRTNPLKRPGIGSGSNLPYTTSIEANLTVGDKISFRAVDSALYYASAHWYFDVIRVA